MIEYLIDLNPGEEPIGLSKNMAETLAQRYVGQQVMHADKGRHITSAQFHPTRGVVLTDKNGYSFTFARIAGTRDDGKPIDDNGEKKETKKEESTTVPVVRKPPKQKIFRHPKSKEGGRFVCTNCGNRVTGWAHKPETCEKLGGPKAIRDVPLPPEEPKKKKKQKKKATQRIVPTGGDTTVTVEVDEDLLEEARERYFNPRFRLTHDQLANILCVTGIQALRKENGRDPVTGDELKGEEE